MRSEAPDFSEPRRLHPASVVIGVDLRRLVQNYLIPAFATFAVAGATLTVGAVVVVVVFVARILDWQRFRYTFDGETLRVDQGVLRRDHRALDVDRIQQVEVERSFVQRLLGLATLRVETAGGGGQGGAVELRVVPEAEAAALRAAVRASASEVAGEPLVGDADEPARREVLQVPLRDVVIAAVTGARLLVFPAVIAGAFQLGGPRVQAWVDEIVEVGIGLGIAERNGDLALEPSAVALVAAGLVLLTVVAAVVVGVLRDANYLIERVEDDLHVSRGLLGTRTSVLPLRRVQLVEVRRNWVRRPLGYASVRVSSAGGSADGGRRVTVPLLASDRIDGLLAEVYEGADGVPDLVSHPRPALRRAIFRWLRAMAVPVVAVWLAPFGWAEAIRLPMLALLPLAAVLGAIEYGQLAHGRSDRLVAARSGALSVTTSLAPLLKIQAVTARASPFQRRLDLATITAHVAGPGGDVVILDTAADDAERLHGVLTEHAAGPVRA